jgi:hypothetical protein
MILTKQYGIADMHEPSVSHVVIEKNLHHR